MLHDTSLVPLIHGNSAVMEGKALNIGMVATSTDAVSVAKEPNTGMSVPSSTVSTTSCAKEEGRVALSSAKEKKKGESPGSPILSTGTGAGNGVLFSQAASAIDKPDARNWWTAAALIQVCFF